MHCGREFRRPGDPFARLHDLIVKTNQAFRSAGVLGVRREFPWVVLTELHRVEKYIPEWMRLDDIEDNRSTDPDLREVAFIFRWDDR